jgi:hypothetical protein
MVSCRHISISVLASLLIALISCGRNSSSSDASNVDVLLQVNDSVLTLNDVLRQIPSGLTPEDSTLMFQHVVDKWVERMVLRSVAEKNIADIAAIDEMVERYRDNLIVNKYLSMMEERGAKDIPEQRIREYYDGHKDLMKLDEPLIKGIFIKTSAGNEELQKLRKWIASATDEDVDNIEKYGLREASQYKYFKDTWTPWHAVAELIPYRFSDADTFLKGNSNFETEYGGSVYMLRITKVMHYGEQTPYEYAKEEIVNMLRTGDMSSYRDNLLKSIYSEAVEDGTIRTGIYDPVNRTYKNNNENNNKIKK